MEKLKTYRWPITVIVFGLSAFVLAVSYDDLQSTKVDLMGLVTTGYGIAEYMVRRSRRNVSEELQSATEGQTSVLLVSIGEGLKRLRTEFRKKHAQNQRALKALRNNFKELRDSTAGKLADIDKHLENRDTVIQEHGSRLEALEQGQLKMIQEISGNTKRLENVISAINTNPDKPKAS